MTPGPTVDHRVRPAPVLSARGLRVELAGGAPVLHGFDLDLAPGEIVGIVGESGSGKTTVALGLLGYARPGSALVGGTVEVLGTDIVGVDDATRRSMRGRVISYVPQDAAQSLNPSLTIGASIGDLINRDRARSRQDVANLLGRVELPTDPAFARRLPHQLSGGQQQRVAIALAIACRPDVVVMDEPTTGLDVITQAGVLAEIRRIREEEGAAIVYVSHDLAVVAELADRVMVMYAGEVVESGPTRDVLAAPSHPYTRALVQSIPDHRVRAELVPIPGRAADIRVQASGCAFVARCVRASGDCRETAPVLRADGRDRQVACLHADGTAPLVRRIVEPLVLPGDAAVVLRTVDLRASYRNGRRRTEVVHGVDLDLRPGESLALVGESGSGKTTIARCLVGLHPIDAGAVLLDDRPLAREVRARRRDDRRRIQYVFQNPYQSLNPRRTIADQVARAAQVLNGIGAKEARARVPHLLELVRLPEHLGARMPRHLSGGELQRVAIARALAASPDVLVCDEITSALDVSVQAAILSLVRQLREETGVATILITHDLGVVAAACDIAVVLERGHVVERGTTDTILAAPGHAYTRRLLAAAPTIDLSFDSSPPIDTPAQGAQQ